MIGLKVIPDRQRIALLRDGHPCRLLGPGIVFVLKLPGSHGWPISIGDRGNLVTLGEARFGEALLPVELCGPATSSSTVQVVGFRENTILVADCGSGSFDPLAMT